MRVAVTGPTGLLGQHLRIALRAGAEHQVVPVDRACFEDTGRLDDALARADVVVHLAGVSRGGPEELEATNAALAQQLAGALSRVPDPPRAVVYANSRRAGADTPYGRGKQRAAEILAGWAQAAGGALVDLRLCNVFGERSRPHHNTVVGTFCSQLAAGEEPTILEDRVVNLLHAQELSARIVAELADLEASRSSVVTGRPMTVSGLLSRLRELRQTYEAGWLPDLSDPFDADLLNTYRSYLFPAGYPRPLRSIPDPAGSRIEELFQSLGGGARTSLATTSPGLARGDHYHLRTVKRLVVLSGTATMALRPILGEQITTYRLGAGKPVFVDVPTLCAYKVANVGSRPLTTVSWTSPALGRDQPDTYPEPVG